MPRRASTAPTGSDPSTDLLSIPDARRAFAAAITRRAIVRYEEALAHQRAAYERADGEGKLEPWTDLATVETADAENQLIAAILTWAEGRGGHMPGHEHLRHYPAAAVACGDRLYACWPDEDE